VVPSKRHWLTLPAAMQRLRTTCPRFRGWRQGISSRARNLIIEKSIPPLECPLGGRR